MLQPLNARLIYSQGGSLGPFPSGTMAQVQCNAGYTLPQGQSSSAYCQQGVWQPTNLPSCIASSGLGNTGGLGPVGYIGNGVGCAPALQPFNGQIQYNGIMNAGIYPSGTTANLMCNAGIIEYKIFNKIYRYYDIW